MSVDRKEFMNEVYDALLVTTSVIGLSRLCKKLLGENLTDANSLCDYTKFGVGISGGSNVSNTSWCSSSNF